MQSEFSRRGQAIRQSLIRSTWIVVVDGAAQFSAGEETVEAPVGTLVRFDPDERHSVRAPGGAKLLLLLAPWPGPGHYRGEQRTAPES